MSHGEFVSQATRGAFVRSDNSVRLLVIDEAHVVRNAATNIARCVAAFSKDKLLLLTGTPAIDRLDDLNSLFDLANPGCAIDADWWHANVTLPIREVASAASASVVIRVRARLAHEHRQRLAQKFVLRRAVHEGSKLPPRFDLVVSFFPSPEQMAIASRIAARSSEIAGLLQCQLQLAVATHPASVGTESQPAHPSLAAVLPLNWASRARAKARGTREAAGRSRGADAREGGRLLCAPRAARALQGGHPGVLPGADDGRWHRHADRWAERA